MYQGRSTTTTTEPTSASSTMASRCETASCFLEAKSRKAATRCLTTTRQLDRHRYLVGGCTTKGFSAAEVGAASLEVVRPCIRHDRAIHDFVACKDIVVFADDMGVVYVSGLDTLKDRILRVPGVILNNAALNSTGLNFSLYMAVDACFCLSDEYRQQLDSNIT